MIAMEWVIVIAVLAIAVVHVLIVLRVLGHLDNISKQTTEMNAYIKVMLEELDRS